MSTESSERFEKYDVFNHESITLLVNTFYTRIQDHPVLAPVFDAHIHNWPVHLGRMVSFWTTILTNVPVYTRHERGGPPQLHQQISELQLNHFNEWLQLWSETATEIFYPQQVYELEVRAAGMARNLSRHLWEGSPFTPSFS